MLLTEVAKARLVFHPQFIEGSYDEATRTADVVIITEGLGNRRDKNFYSADTLREAAQSQVFEGAQAYADHPSRFDDANRPERSVRDLIGYYFNTRLATAVNPQGQSVPALAAKFRVQEGCDWVVGLIKEAIAYQQQFPNKVYAGISINADGDTEPGEYNGEKVNLVKRITEVFSADTVTKPARGGKFLKFVEGASGALSSKENQRMTVLEAAAKLNKLAEGKEVDPAELQQLAAVLTEASKESKENVDVKSIEAKKEANDGDEDDAKKEAKAKPAVAADDDETQESEEAKEAKKETKTTEASVGPTLWNAALREARATVGNDVAKLQQENAELKAQLMIRESITTATKILKESIIPAGGHQKILSDLIGLTESEMRDKVKAEEDYIKSLGITTGQKIAGAGASGVPVRENEVKANTAKLCEGLEV